MTDHPFIRYLGRISFGIYIVHSPLLTVYFRTMSYAHQYVHGYMAEVIGISFYLVKLFAICHLLYNYYERYFTSMKPSP